MLNALLGWTQYPIGDGAFYALFGFVFVISGIALLVLIFTGLGVVMNRVNGRKKEVQAPKVAKPVSPSKVDDGVSPEVVAAITAALMAFYEQENVKCDFVVKRIKRI